MITLMSYAIVVSCKVNDIEGPVIESYYGVSHNAEVLYVRGAPGVGVFHKVLKYLP
jgi:hypothetical protein